MWQHAHTFVLDIYRVTADFPSHERYGLVSQMRRAAVSIAANIVEGHKRRSRKEFLNFLNIADSSLEELKYYLLLSRDLQYLASSVVKQLYQQAERVGRMLSGLKAHIKQGVANEHTLRSVPAGA